MKHTNNVKNGTAVKAIEHSRVLILAYVIKCPLIKLKSTYIITCSFNKNANLNQIQQTAMFTLP